MALKALSDSGITDIGKLFQVFPALAKKKIYRYHLMQKVGEKVHSPDGVKLLYFGTSQLEERYQVKL